MSVCTSIRPQKGFFDFSKIWYVGRDRRVMHDGMQYNQIQGHEPLKIGICAIFKVISSPIYNGGWQMTTDS